LTFIIEFLLNEQQWRAGYSESCKSGSGRGWRKPTAAMRQGGASLLYVLNSVSFADGKKFRSNYKTYFGEIRKTSDELCRENNLSVIEPNGKGKHYAEWRAEQRGKPTIRSQVRADIDEIIPKAINFDMFVGLLRQEATKSKLTKAANILRCLRHLRKGQSVYHLS